MSEILKGVPKFLIAENNADADGKIYIVSTEIPFMFFEAVHVETEDKLETTQYSAFSYYLNPEGTVETHYIQLMAAFGNDFESIDIMTRIKAAADWYTSYLAFLDGYDKAERN